MIFTLVTTCISSHEHDMPLVGSIPLVLYALYRNCQSTMPPCPPIHHPQNWHVLLSDKLTCQSLSLNHKASKFLTSKQKSLHFYVLNTIPHRYRVSSVGQLGWFTISELHLSLLPFTPIRFLSYMNSPISVDALCLGILYVEYL